LFTLICGPGLFWSAAVWPPLCAVEIGGDGCRVFCALAKELSFSEFPYRDLEFETFSKGANLLFS
jgi:hypothetical protein